MPLHRISRFAPALLSLALLIPLPASAKPRRAHRARKAPAAPPPERQYRAPEPVGELREASLVAPAAVAVADEQAPLTDRKIFEVERDPGPLSSPEARAEIAAHQLQTATRRNQRAISACTAAAQRRRPAAAGAVELALEIRDSKVASVRVGRDSLQDDGLTSCLTTVARGFRFSLTAAQVTWPIEVSASEAR